MENNMPPSELRTKIAGKLDHIRGLCEENRVSRDILKEIDALDQMVRGKEKEAKLDLSAQLSIYPLRQPSLSPTIHQALNVLKRHHLKLIPGSMSTLILGTEDVLWEGLKEAFSKAAGGGEVVMIVSISNACPKPSD